MTAAFTRICFPISRAVHGIMPRSSVCAALALSGCLAAGGAVAQAPQLIGWVEPVAVGDGKLVLRAKIDTGADVSSLDIDELRIEERGAERWAVFDVKSEAGTTTRFEARVVRYARIKRVAGGVLRRPVVLLELCLGSVGGRFEVNLVDRLSMRYQMLIGRNFLKGRFAVDSARILTTQPSCTQGKAR